MYVHTWAEMKLGLVIPVAHARHNITKASGLTVPPQGMHVAHNV